MSALGGKVALVTGASGGIGRAIAIALSAEGAAVCVTGRNEALLADAASACPGKEVAMRAADLSDRSAAITLHDFVIERYGRLDVLIHCAGIVRLDRMGDAALADLDAQIAVNLYAPYLLTRTLLPALLNSSGDIVFVVSSITRFPRADGGQYAMTKSALVSMADCLRHEVNEQGVRVLSVFPGRTATRGQENIFRSEGRDYDPSRLLQPEDVASTIVHALTLPRTAEVTEIHLRPMNKS